MPHFYNNPKKSLAEVTKENIKLLSNDIEILEKKTTELKNMVSLNEKRASFQDENLKTENKTLQ